MVGVAYPVAYMRSMLSRILLRVALWVGSDRPIPRGSAGVPIEVGVTLIEGRSSAADEGPMDEIEDVLLLWGF